MGDCARYDGRVKRRPTIRLILLLMLCGAIVNIVVAWGIAISAPMPRKLTPTVVTSTDHDWWRACAPDQYQEVSPNAAFVHSTTGATLLRLAVGTGGMDSPMAHRFRSGWPATSMERSQWSSLHRVEWIDTWTVYKPLAFSVPMRPYWPGFAINTVFYAAVLWGLSVAPFTLRRRRRIKRGLCLKCGYDLRGSPPTSDACPECGAAAGPILVRH